MTPDTSSKIKRFFTPNSLWEWIGKAAVLIGALYTVLQFYKEFTTPRARLIGTIEIVEVLFPPHLIPPQTEVPKYCVRVKLANDGMSTLNDVSVKIPFTKNYSTAFAGAAPTLAIGPDALEFGKLQAGNDIVILAWADSVTKGDLDSIKAVFDGGMADMKQIQKSSSPSVWSLSLLTVVTFLVISALGKLLERVLFKRVMKSPLFSGIPGTQLDGELQGTSAAQFPDTSRTVKRQIFTNAWDLLKREYVDSIKFRFLYHSSFLGFEDNGDVLIGIPSEWKEISNSTIGEIARREASAKLASMVEQPVKIIFAYKNENSPPLAKPDGSVSKKTSPKAETDQAVRAIRARLALIEIRKKCSDSKEYRWLANCELLSIGEDGIISIVVKVKDMARIPSEIVAAGHQYVRNEFAARFDEKVKVTLEVREG